MITTLRQCEGYMPVGVGGAVEAGVGIIVEGINGQIRIGLVGLPLDGNDQWDRYGDAGA